MRSHIFTNNSFAPVHYKQRNSRSHSVAGVLVRALMGGSVGHYHGNICSMAREMRAGMHTHTASTRPLALSLEPERTRRERKRMLKNIIMHGWHPAASAHGSHGKRESCAIKRALSPSAIFSIARACSISFCASAVRPSQTPGT